MANPAHAFAMPISLSTLKQVLLCTPPLSGRWASTIPPEAVSLCAADAGLEPDQVHFGGPIHVGKSLLLHLVCEGAGPSAQGYVIKLPRSSNQRRTWDPVNEYEGFSYAHRRLGAAASIVPVGHGQRSPFLVTRYVAGASTLRVFDLAVKHGRSAAYEQAAALAHDMGRWLIAFRGPLELAPGVLAELRREGQDLARALGDGLAGAGPRRFERAAERGGVLKELMQAALAPRAAKGDLAPQNFQLTSDGRLLALDFEGFGWDVAERDVIEFRRRMEYYALAGARHRRLATNLWRSFCQGYGLTQHEPLGSAAVLSYLPLLASRLHSAARRGRWRDRLKMSRRQRAALRWTQRWVSEAAGPMKRLEELFVRQL